MEQTLQEYLMPFFRLLNFIPESVYTKVTFLEQVAIFFCYDAG